MTQPLHIGLLGAMPEEVGSDLSHLTDLSCSDHGDLTIHRGVWGENIRLSLAWSGWGKVSAARAATTHTCSLAINARSSLLGTVGLPAQS